MPRERHRALSALRGRSLLPRERHQVSRALSALLASIPIAPAQLQSPRVAHAEQDYSGLPPVSLLRNVLLAGTVRRPLRRLHALWVRSLLQRERHRALSALVALIRQAQAQLRVK